MSDASILFSGGPDSTLAALYALEKFDRVHLLTYHHKLMYRTGRHITVVQEMRKIFGNDRIIGHEENIDPNYKICYFKDISKYIKKYRTYYIPWLCGACKMVMHFSTINYNRKFKISTTYDGANMESAPIFPAQTQEYISVIKDLYKSYKMEYECPIYEVTGTDKETEKFGLTTTKDTKKEHIFFSTQHSCFVGLLLHAHARFYYRPIRGRKRMSQISSIFLKEMIDNCRSLLPEVE